MGAIRRFVALAFAVGCGGGGGASDSDAQNGDGNTGGDGMQSIDAAPAVCGDTMRVRGEECDDGNLAPGDGCDATCRVEPYAGAPQAAVDAMRAVNGLRASADLPGARLQDKIVLAAQNHASYYANNAAAYAGGLSAHDEDPAFPNGFTGANFGRACRRRDLRGRRSSRRWRSRQTRRVRSRSGSIRCFTAFPCCIRT